MNNNQNQEPPPQNGPPPMVRPNGQAPQTMEELCQPSVNGRGRPITSILIQATDFSLRHHMIQQVQNTCQFHGLPGDDANQHIDKFLEITQHMKQNGVSDDALRLSLFPYSLTHHAIACGVTLAGPSVSPSSSSKEVDREPETITNQVLTGSTNNVLPLVVQSSPTITSFSNNSSSKIPEVTKDTVQLSTENIQPPVAQTKILIHEPVVAPKTKPTIPNPSRVNKQKLHEKDDNLALKFVEIFRNLHFELSFADNLLHMPKFALMFKKKLGYPDKFLIPCDFPEFDECLALADLAGIAEDVFVKVGKFYFPTDFVVVDYVVDPRVPLILGRPFLRTGRALIDVYGEELTLCVDDEAITFKEKTTFTCPYGTFAYRIMPFGLCNAPGTFQRPMIHLLEKETPFVFSKDCIDAFETLKKKLTEALILVVPDWNLPFKLMCDASDFAIGAILRQRKTKHFQPIHYASKTMTEAQIHYNTTKKEMLVVVYAVEKFQPYFLSKSIVYTDHSALKYLLNKQDAKPRLIQWVFLLQEFDIIIRDKKGTKNLVADHLSRLENPYMDVLEHKDINENFPLETLGKISSESTPWFADFANYHTSRKVEVLNRGLKRILERTVCENRASWSKKLEDALWAFRTAYKTPIGCTPYKLVYGKSCHLPIELEHKAYWALKHANFDFKTAGDHRKLQLNELNKLRDQAYENSLIYKEKTKKLHDSKIKNRIFNVGDRVLLFNSRLKIFSGKLKTRWTEPFTIAHVFPYGTIKLSQPDGPIFKVNGHRVKDYFGEDIPQLVILDLQTFPMDQ
nr:reverse transcriptase domain-containing protein [Tanacetum cinerariifolium]